MSATETKYEEGTPAFKKRFMIRLWAVLIGGTIIDGYILGIIGPVTATLRTDLGMDSTQVGLLAAMALIGILIGSPAGGWAADRFGRKPMFIADITLFTIASVMQFFVNTPETLMVVRFLMGVAIGAEYSVSWPMMSEFSPAKLRGRLLAISNGVFYVGFMLAYTIAYFGSMPSINVHWRWILGSSTILAVALLIGRIGLPESARWLWAQGRTEEASKVAYKFMNGAADIADFKKEAATPHEEEGRFLDIFSPAYIRATVFVSIFWFVNVLPFFGIATFADDVLTQYGLSGGLANGVGLSMVSVLGVTVLIIFVDKVGRRVFTVPPLWIIMVIFLIIGLWSDAPAPLVLALFLIFSFLSGMSGPMTAIYPGELFPTRIRGKGTGFAAAFSRVGAAIGTFFVPVGIEYLGISTVILILAGIVAVGAIVSQMWAPETKGKSLSETAAGYGN